MPLLYQALTIPSPLCGSIISIIIVFPLLLVLLIIMIAIVINIIRM